MDCCEHLVVGLFEVLLTLVSGVGSLLRAALGHKTREGGKAQAVTPGQFMFRASMSQACWSETGDIYN